MSILAKEDRKDLVWAMRTSLLEQVRSGVLTESAKAAAENFILNEGTYEQLLNLAFNPERETNYMPTEVLEKVAMEAYETILTEGTQSGSIFASIEESALQEGKLVKGAKWVETKAKAGWDMTKAQAQKMWEKAKAAGETAKEFAKKHWKAAAILGIGGAVGYGAAHALKKRREKKAKK